MTGKLKCPFCGEELSPSYGYGIEVYMCPNLTCHKAPGYAEDGVWQALIQAKQDLEIARKTLEDIDMLLHSRKFDITELGRLNIIQYLVSRVLKLTEHKE